jgi:multidrug efflux pump subunit AcrB
MDTYTIAYTVKSAVNRAKVGVYREGKEEYDILLSAADGARASIHRGPFEHGVGTL